MNKDHNNHYVNLECNANNDTPARGAQLTPRQVRLVGALLQGSVMREAADRIAGASNSPHNIMELRRKGLLIHCERLDRVDRDGKPTRPGRYRLAPESAPLARELLAFSEVRSHGLHPC